MTLILDAMRRIEQRLSETLGFDVETIGSATVDRAVHDRMRHCAIASMDEYAEHVLHDAKELQLLIEQVVIPETWFFRNAEAFHVLRDVVAKKAAPAQREVGLRILSVPCSTGEEPYSIAITLLEMGLTPRQTRIDAFDVSERALAFAEQGIYSANSFRGEGQSVRDRYCDPTADHRFQLRPEIRSWVKFGRANLALPGFQSSVPAYDAIFCRNLLIYFDRAAQAQAFQTLSALLAPDGYLFVGPAEVPLATAHGFHSAGYHMAFCCRKDRRPHPRIRTPRAIPMTELAGPPRPLSGPARPAIRGIHRPAVQAPSPARPSSTVPPANRPGTGGPAKGHPVPQAGTTQGNPPGANGNAAQLSVDDHLHVVRALADAGRLEAAAAACEPLLRTYTTSAEIYYLFGVIQDAMGDVERAIDCYRKVLFLDPNHSEASMHLATLAHRDGNLAAAERLHARRRRIEQRNQQ